MINVGPHSISRVYIIDPALTERRGHMYTLAVGLADAARARGFECVVLCHAMFQPDRSERKTFIPYFTETTLSTEPSTSMAWKSLNLNREFLAQFIAMEDRFNLSNSIFIYPTTNYTILDAIRHFSKREGGPASGIHIISLMLQSGIMSRSDNEYEIMNNDMAEIYRHILRRFDITRNQNCIMCTNSPYLARSYSLLLGRDSVRIHPTPCGTPDVALAPERFFEASDTAKNVVLNIGEVKPEKGFGLLPDILERSIENKVPANYFVHVYGVPPLLARFSEEIDRLRAIAAATPAVHLHEGFLPPPTYYSILSSADAILLPYDAQVYHDMTSGVTMESLFYDVPMVVPKASWLQFETQSYGAGVVEFEGFNSDAPAEALEELIANHDAMKAASVAAGVKYRASNGFDRFFDVVVDWCAGAPGAPMPLGAPGPMAGHPIIPW